MRDDVPATPPSSYFRRLDWHVVTLLLAAAAALFSRFFRAYTLGFFEDDFFYYVVAAQHFIQHGTSSFDGIHLTNGYHPLWFLVIAAASLVTHGTAFLILIQVLSLLLLLLFFFSASKVFERCGLQSGVARTTSLLLSLHTLLLFRYGMEVNVALPAGLAMLAYLLNPAFQWTGRQTATYGLLACITVLGRLDSALLIFLLIATQVLNGEWSWSVRLRRVAVFSLGFLPLFVYLALNRLWFHSLLPISGRAKQLKPLLPPSFTPLRSLLLPMDFNKAAFVVPALILLGAALWRSRRVLPFLRPQQQSVCVALLAFPFVHLATFSLLSDWNIWPWYFYSLTYSSLASLALLLIPAKAGKATQVGEATHTLRTRWTPILALSCAVYVIYFAIYAVNKKTNRLAPLAAMAADFTRSHPGNYAMGDGAGTTAYLSPRSFVQVEGLMMDAAYVDRIARRTPLHQIMTDYQVRYYLELAGRTPHPVDGCYPLSEPHQAGPASPHMQGRICAAPIAKFDWEDTSIFIFDANDVQ